MKNTVMGYTASGAIVPVDSDTHLQSRLHSASLMVEPPKRRSRWEDGNSFRLGRKKLAQANTRQSRWNDKSFTAPPVTHIPDFLSPDQLELVLRQYRIEDISRRLAANDFEIHDPDVRSPSPEPIYDPKTGVRINTREYRAREQLNKERNTCIEECLKIDPDYRPPADYKPPKATRKLYIPQNGETPQESYVSLILGPRGVTQKALEKQTKCKIYIRGHGASRGKNYTFENEDEPMHVLIQADTEEDVENACAILEPILSGKLDDEENRKHRMDLMLMASNNHLALKHNDWCEQCGEHGHKKWVCPNRVLGLAWLDCEICHEHSHEARDCPQSGGKKRKTLEEELDEFARETGVALKLTEQDKAIAKAHRQLLKSKLAPAAPKPKSEPHPREDNLLPPGVEF